MRLIDADRLEEEIKRLRCTLIGLRAGKGVLARAADEYRKSILQIIDDQPTAFDKEKVIEEIKRERDVAQECNQYSAISAHELDIVIVEEGGIE